MLTERQAFKAGFLYKCADAGLTMDEAAALAKAAAAHIKTAGVQDLLMKPYNAAIDVAGQGLSRLGTLGIAGLVAGPALLGGAAGLGLSKLMDVDDTDVKSVKKQELIDEYRRQVRRLKARTERV
jgi:hypothetical protein